MAAHLRSNSSAAPNRWPPWLPDALAITALVLIVLIPRVAALGADPPVGSEVGGAFWDEGVWARNARQHVLFGRWVIDEVNPSLFVAPLYTLALSGVYEVLGVGLVQTRLLSGLAGFLTCTLVYLVLRTCYPVRYALPPALVLGTSYFVLTNDRVAFTEPFQLFWITGTFAAAFLSIRRPSWAVVAGVCFVLSLLSKPSAVVMGFVLAGFWALHFLASRKYSLSPAFSFRQPLLFFASSSITLLVVLVVIVIPHWQAVSQQLAISLRDAFVEESHPTADRVLFLGWSGLGMRLNAFFRETAVPLAAVLLLLVARLARAVRKPMDLMELFCWAWLGVGLPFLARQPYQPDRRFLFLMPAVAILACMAAQQGGMVVPGRKAMTERGQWWTRLLIGAFIGGVVGFYAQPHLVALVSTVVGRAGVTLTPSEAATLIWNASVLGGAVLVPAAARLLPEEARRIPVLLFLVAFLISNPGRFALYARHLTYTLLDASRALGALTAGWKAEDRVMVGGSADTFGLETTLFTFAIRERGPTHTHWNLDGWERFDPSLAIISMRERGIPNEERIEPVLARGLVPLREFGIIPEQDGRPRWRALLFIKPALCQPNCP